MVRSLWTAASGMIAQQNNVDTIANNLANVNTSGYKTEVAEFKSLLYQDIKSKSTSANSEQKPIPSQVGLGVRNSAITSIFTQGAFLDSSNDLSFAINGDGFFGVKGQDGNTYYTRNGNFVLATDTNGLALTTTDGFVKTFFSRNVFLWLPNSLYYLLMDNSESIKCLFLPLASASSIS